MGGLAGHCPRWLRGQAAYGRLTAPQPTPPRAAMLQAALWSAWATTPHDRQAKVSWSGRFRLSRYPQPAQVWEVYRQGRVVRPEDRLSNRASWTKWTASDLPGRAVDAVHGLIR